MEINMSCILYKVNMLLFKMTLICCSCQVWGYPHFITCLPGFWESICLSSNYIIFSSWPLILCWAKCCQSPESCHRYVQEKSHLHFKLLLPYFTFLQQSWITLTNSTKVICFVSMVWETLWPSFNGSLPVNSNSLSRKVISKLPFSTLELACLNGWFFAFDDRFMSLAFNRMILQVFDFNFPVHTRGLCCCNLRAIAIIGGFSRAR